MKVSASQLVSRAFPPGLHENIFVVDVGGLERLQDVPQYSMELAVEDKGNVKTALVESLRVAGLLSSNETSARYRLSALVTGNKNNTTIGAQRSIEAFTVTTSMQFKLVDSVTGETRLQETVQAPATVPFSRSNFPAQVSEATEGSIRGSFQLLLDRLELAHNQLGYRYCPRSGCTLPFTGLPTLSTLSRSETD
jgi:hypothetical protein